MVRLHLLDTGFCLASEHHMLQGGARRRVECHALVGLIEHPNQGYLLFDAGYAPRLLVATRGWPSGLYRAATPVRLARGLAVGVMLPRLGFAPA
ncbi:MAG: MBL fold metallo-hydrolase, partial [Roseiflexaceae bacterium]|nr:MBL fold metallo-hydrolase [Roseiflexaceae bacterium]